MRSPLGKKTSVCTETLITTCQAGKSLCPRHTQVQVVRFACSRRYPPRAAHDSRMKAEPQYADMRWNASRACQYLYRRQA